MNLDTICEVGSLMYLYPLSEELLTYILRDIIYLIS